MNPKTRHVQTFITVIVLLTLTMSAFRPPAVVSAQGQQDDGIVREYNSESNKVTMITGSGNEPIQMMGIMQAGQTDEQRADMLVQSFAPEFGVIDPQNDLQIMEQDRPGENRLTTRYQQTYNGVPVMAGELIVNASEEGALYSMNGEAAQGLSLDTTPSLTADEALKIARQGMVKWYQGEAADYTITKPAELWIFDEKLLKPSIRPAELVWRLEMTSAEGSAPIRELVLVNAQTGNVPLHFNQVDTAWSGEDLRRQGDEPPVTPTPTEPPQATETPEPTLTPIPPDVEAAQSGEESFQPTPTPSVSPTVEESDFHILAGPFYVDIATGNNSNSCTSKLAPCKNIQQAIEKGTGTGEIIYIASGTYTWSDSAVHPGWANVVITDRGVTLSGGWDATFTNQNGVSIIDGQNLKNGILARAGVVCQ